MNLGQTVGTMVGHSRSNFTWSIRGPLPFMDIVGSTVGGAIVENWKKL